jgi:hypothetical protein
LRRILQSPGRGGWTVLAERLPAFGGQHRDLAERLLEHLDLSRPPVCVFGPQVVPADTRRFLEDLEAWLDVPAQVVGIGEARSSGGTDLGLVVLAGGPLGAWLEDLGQSELDEIPDRLGEGSVILAVGPAAAALGTWALVPGSPGLSSGRGWLRGAVIVPGSNAPSDFEPVRELLGKMSKTCALGLPEGAMLAVGPSGEIEVWGELRPTLVLGRGWAEE